MFFLKGQITQLQFELLQFSTTATTNFMLLNEKIIKKKKPTVFLLFPSGKTNKQTKPNK